MSRRAGLAIGISLGLLLLAAWSVAQTRFTADLAAFLPRSPSPAQQVLVDQLRDGVVSRLILIGIERAEPEQLARVSNLLAGRLARDEGFVYVNNGAEDRLQADAEFLLEHRYLLSDAVSAERFSREALRASLEEQLDLLASPMSMLVTRVMPRDPSGELLYLFERLQQYHAPDKRHGVWFGARGTRALLLAQTAAPGFDLDAQQAALDRIRSAFVEAAREAQAADAVLLTTGPGVFAVASREGIKADVIRVSTIALTLVALLLIAVFRSPRVLLLTLLPVGSGALAGVAAVGLAFGTVHGITLGFGATLIGEAVDYAIYLFASTAAGSTPGSALARIWPVLRLGVLTSVVGFGAMLFSGFPGLAQLGLFSLTGLIVAVAVTRWMLPLLAPANFSARSVDAIAPRLATVLDPLRLLRAPLYFLVAAAGVWLLLPGKQVWNDDLASLSPVPEAEQKLDESMRGDLGAPDVRQIVVVRADGEQAALEKAEAVARVLDALRARRVLADYDSPALYLPSAQMQRARQAALPERSALRTRLAQALEGLPYRSDIFEPFIADAARARAASVLTRADLRGTSLALRVDSLLVERGDEWAAMLPLRGVADDEALEQALAGFDDGRVVLLDLKREADAVYQDYRSRVLKFSLLGGSAMVILLLVALRSPARTWEVIAPLMAALVVTCAILLIGGPLNIFHLVGMLLVAGVGSNYTLFFERGGEADEARGRTLSALLICNLSTVIGFGAISLADTPVLQAIGGTVAIGAFLSLLFAAILTEREPD